MLRRILLALGLAGLATVLVRKELPAIKREVKILRM
jgi:hypothetical protein